MKKSKITTAQRRAYVMSQRDAGLSFEEIAKDAVTKFGRENLPKGYNKRLAHLDMSRELNKRPASKLTTAIRRKKILQYRMTGMNYQQIVDRLIEEFGEDELPTGYNASHACRDLQRYLNQIDTENKADIVEIKNIHRERLNYLLNILWKKASEGDLPSIDRTLKIMESLIKLSDVEHITPSKTCPDEESFNSFADISEQLFKLSQNGNCNGNNK